MKTFASCIKKNIKFRWNYKFIKMSIFAIVIAFLLFLVLILLPSCISHDNQSKNVSTSKSNQFCVMSTTDMHGKAWDYDLLTDDTVENSFLKIYSATKEIKADFYHRNILFDNGDLYQGTDLASFSLKPSVYDRHHYLSPIAYCLQFCGYDGFTLGNHEFNFNWLTMSNTYQYLKCAGIPCVCANIYDKTSGQRIFDPYLIKHLTIDGNDFKVAIIGLENTDCPKWDIEAHYPNMIFHSIENTNADQAYEIQKVQNEMKAAGQDYDFLIVSMHSGFVAEGAPYDESCDYFSMFEQQAQEPLEYLINTENQTYRTIKNSNGVNMFITGHDHVDYFSNRHVINNSGQDVLMVSGAGKSLTKSVFNVDKDPSSNKYIVSIEDSQNLDLSQYENSEDLRSCLKMSVGYSEDYLNRFVATLQDGWDNNISYEPSDFYLQQTDTMDLILRSQLWQSNKFLSETYPTVDSLNAKLQEIYGEDSGIKINDSKPQTDISFTTCGCIAENPAGGGDIYMKDVRKIYKFNNSLVAIPIKGDYIKSVLEYNASDRLRVTKDDNGEKNIKIIGDKYSYIEAYGLDFYYDMNKPVGQRVTINGFTNGKNFDPNEYYIVSLTNYICDNEANPYLASLKIQNDLFGSSQKDYQTVDIISDYCEKIYNDYELVYNTKDAEKNCIQTSKWEIRY